MDSGTFDRLARMFGAGTTRRRALAAVLGAALGGAFAADPASARRGADAAGPCGDGSRKDNRCSSDKQCCTGICDVELGKKNRDKVGRCRCLKNGKPCKADRNCCKSSVCFQGSCARCRKQDQSCEESSDCCGGNSCLNGACAPCVASGAACSASGDCCSGLACYNGACAPCVADGKRCAAASDCCDGSICLDGVCASCTPEGGACQAPGLEAADDKRQPRATLPCCSGLTCAEGVCHKPAVVKTGEACVIAADTCEDPDASCTTHDFDKPEGTYCLLPRTAKCTRDADCVSNDCLDRVCISCSHEACPTACTPIVCKSGCTYSTVQAAINAASHNTVIDIGAGTYEEDLVASGYITLRACKGEEVILRNKSLGARTITMLNFSALSLIDIIVDARNDPENEIWGGGIRTLYSVGLYRNTVVRKGAWEYGGGIMLGDSTPVSPSGLPKRAAADDPVARAVQAHGLLEGRPDRKAYASWMPAEQPDDEQRAGAPRTTPSNVNVAVVAVADQSVVANNSAKYFGGGIYASYEGLPTTPTQNFPGYPTIVLDQSAKVQDNQVTSTDAPRGIQLQGPPGLTAYGGGGIFAFNAVVALRDDAHVYRNIGDWHGGGVMLIPLYGQVNGTFIMRGNARISDNRSYHGGGASLLMGNKVIQQKCELWDASRIEDNIAEGDGGGIWLEGVPLRMYDEATIDGNSAREDGGGIAMYGPITGINYPFAMGFSSTITNNTANRGAGVFLSAASGIGRGGSSISFNLAQGDGGGVFLSFLDEAPGFNSTFVLDDDSSSDEDASPEIFHNVAGDSGSGRGGGIFSDSINNQVVADSDAIRSNNPDNVCFADGNGGCIV